MLESEIGYNAFIPHFTTSTFVLKYLGLVLFVVNFLLWKFFKGTIRVHADTMDLLTGRQENCENVGVVV
jgi:amino acid permease